ncbi:hypothetical protein [Sphingopyxis lindanitolerans]|nr:hypothetical protein [Sphingopyxis lindanitolerans]
MIDLLFLPFLLPVPVPLSFAVLPIWLLSLRPERISAGAVIAIIGAMFAIFSYILGINSTPGIDDSSIRRSAYTAIIIFMFGTYVAGSMTNFRTFHLHIHILRLYLIFVFLLSIIFFWRFDDYFLVRQFWAFGDNVDIADNLNTLTRFTGTLSDPNNLAVSTVAITAFLVFFAPQQVGRNIAAMAMTAVIVIASMSSTGIICYAALIVAFITGSRLKTGPRILLLLGSVIVGIAIYDIVKNTDVFALASQRVADTDSESRLSRWQLALDSSKFLSSLIVGDGGTILLNGMEYKPHNGHIHVAYSFGLVCYIAFATIFFRVYRIRDWRHYLFLAIIFTGFTVNVGIYEHRFAGIWVVLLVIYHRLAAPQPAPKRITQQQRAAREGSVSST